MSKKFKSITAHLYSVHWENDAAHGYFNQVYRILANDAADAIRATYPEHGLAKEGTHVKSVDLLAENLTVLVSPALIGEAYESDRRLHSDDKWLEMLGKADRRQR